MKKQAKKKSADAAPIGHVRRFLAIVNAIRARDFPQQHIARKGIEDHDSNRAASHNAAAQPGRAA
jgi:hypothetical protein